MAGRGPGSSYLTDETACPSFCTEYCPVSEALSESCSLTLLPSVAALCLIAGIGCPWLVTSRDCILVREALASSAAVSVREIDVDIY